MKKQFEIHKYKNHNLFETKLKCALCCSVVRRAAPMLTQLTQQSNVGCVLLPLLAVLLLPLMRWYLLLLLSVMVAT